MPIPVTPILDSFDRPDENPLAGSWTDKVLPSDGNLQIVTNQVAAVTAVRSSAWWNAATFTEAAEAYISIPTLPTSVAVGLFLRLTSPGTGGASGYMGWWQPSLGYRIWRLDSGTYTALTTYSASPAPSAGDTIAFRAYQSNLVLSVLHSGSWTEPRSVVDATYANGYIGLIGDSETGYRLDNFGGGAVDPAETRDRIIIPAPWLRKPRVVHPRLRAPTVVRSLPVRLRLNEIAVPVRRDRIRRLPRSRLFAPAVLADPAPPTDGQIVIHYPLGIAERIRLERVQRAPRSHLSPPPPILVQRVDDILQVQRTAAWENRRERSLHLPHSHLFAPAILALSYQLASATAIADGPDATTSEGPSVSFGARIGVRIAFESNTLDEIPDWTRIG